MAAQSDFTTIVADDLPLMSESLAALCEGFPGCRVLGFCHDGTEALRMIDILQPDVALLDMNLSKSPTLDVLRTTRSKGHRTRLIVLGCHGDRRTVIEALRTGANGFVLKHGTGRQLEEALRQVIQGAVYVSPSIDLQHLVDKPEADRQDPLRTLSTREYQVFTLLIEGVRAKDIASRLDLSPKTVDTYRANLMRKLDLHDVPSLVKFAIHRKLTQ